MPTGRSSVEVTADAIMDYIRNNRLQAGDLLPTEMQLCQELKVARSSVREAMRYLSSLDIVEVRHGCGTYVGSMSLSPLVNGLVLRILIDTDHSVERLRDVVNTRIALDIHLTDVLLELHHRRSHPKLHSLINTMYECYENHESFVAEDRAFHTLLLADIDNELIKELAEAFWQVHTQAVPTLGFSSDTDIVCTIESHREMLLALETGDPERYQKAVYDHYQPLLRQIDRASGRHTDDDDDDRDTSSAMDDIPPSERGILLG